MIPTADVGVEASIEGDYKLVVLPVEAGLSAYGVGPIPVDTPVPTDTPVPGALPELYGEYAAELWPREEIRELSVITARRLSGLVLTPADETETEDLLALLYPGLEAFTREAELPVGVGLTGVELLLGNGEDSTPIQILEGGGEQYLLVGLGSKQQTYSAPRGTLELEAIGELTRAVLRRSGSSWTQH